MIRMIGRGYKPEKRRGRAAWGSAKKSGVTDPQWAGANHGNRRSIRRHKSVSYQGLLANRC
eukprot:10542681-Lingulodinium_polyedra.AAC.1